MFLRFFAIVRNEIKLLFKDLPGLLILFIMPMLLVLTLTALHSSDDHPREIPILLLDQDQGKAANELIKHLEDNSNFLVDQLKSNSDSAIQEAKRSIQQGKYQIFLIIPKHLTQGSKDYSKWLMKGNTKKPEEKTLQVYLDPTLPVALKNIVESELKQVDKQLQIKSLQAVLKNFNPQKKFGDETAIVKLQTEYLNASADQIRPKPAQHYVPAWTIFGMFLIMIPLAGVYVKEREQGIIQRLAVAPVPKLYFLLARFLTFVIINMLQLILMLSAGIFILPYLHIEPLNALGHLHQIVIIGLCISACATAFGIFLGVYVRTFEQAMALGPTLIIIAAALGGIMAPIYLMPASIKAASIYSPLFWAQNSFINLLVRGESLTTISPDLLKLLALACICIALALFKYLKTE